MLSLLKNFSALADDYDVLLCDVWGVVHNGVAAHASACDALVRFRNKGGRVCLLTNAPRPGESVARQFEALKVPREIYDVIVSSGDLTRAIVIQRKGQSVLHIGPPRDRPVFEGLDVTFAPAESADYAVCSGLDDDDTETPEDYRAMLETMLARKMFMLCANPDLVVERGGIIVYCAGSIAELYRRMGGEVLFAGKPHRPIYEKALQAVGGAPLPRVLAIGDSVRTDLTGAAAFGVDFLLITAGIHAEELGGDTVDPAKLEKMLASGPKPKAVMQKLAW